MSCLVHEQYLGYDIHHDDGHQVLDDIKNQAQSPEKTNLCAAAIALVRLMPQSGILARMFASTVLSTLDRLVHLATALSQSDMWMHILKLDDEYISDCTEYIALQVCSVGVF